MIIKHVTCILLAAALSFSLALAGCETPDKASAAQDTQATQDSSSAKNSTSQVGPLAPAKGVADADIVIPIADISDTASFYAATVDGIQMEVIAVQAPDGSYRTAFNTCQVCYDSGRGYYVQQGDYLVCQNCGNRFATDDVEVKSGGCNPVPIFDEDKQVGADSITIPLTTLQAGTKWFERWKY